MKNLIFILSFLCFSFHSFAQNENKITMTKKGMSYDIITHGKNVNISIINNTTNAKAEALQKAIKNPRDQRITAEQSIAMSYIYKDKTNNIYQFTIKAIEKVFGKKDIYKGYTYKYLGDKVITSSIIFGSSGEIISIEFFLKHSLAQHLTYDKLIELETIFRKEYKIPPLRDKNVTYVFVSIPLMTINELNILK